MNNLAFWVVTPCSPERRNMSPPHWGSKSKPIKKPSTCIIPTFHLIIIRTIKLRDMREERHVVFTRRRKIYRRVLSEVTPYNPIEFYQCFGEIYCLYLPSRRGRQPSNETANEAFAACFTWYSTLEMEAARSFVTSINIYQTTRRHIPEDSSLHSYLERNLFILRRIGLEECDELHSSLYI
jgi:hypothetical protein